MSYAIRQIRKIGDISENWLAEQPIFGRFLRWSPEQENAYRYPTKTLAVMDARYTWLSEWEKIVEIVEVP